MLRLFNEYPSRKVVYIAPLKALARQRIDGWGQTFGKLLGKSVVELTGDVTPDLNALMRADILISTPEKWDGVSRNWRSENRTYVQAVGLVVIDEIHLLGQDRGPVLEVIVSRMRYISSQTNNNCRIVGLSTALSNATDLAMWLGIDKIGFFNFPPSVRPVPLAVHITGFSGRHYCPRMATMNKPAYVAITTYSPTKPVLVFVSSRRQTRLTALDLIFYAASDGNSRRFSSLSEDEFKTIREVIHDPSLRHTLEFGVGLHHAGLRDPDRKLVETLFLNGKIQVLVCTSTLAWGVNLPAHLVIIKGTEFFDPKKGRYVDFPITDVLQMMGRAGRPQFDNEGQACIFVHEPKKHFYRKFLYDPFPVESSLLDVLHDHINAEVCNGTIGKITDAIDYLTWTFFFRRLLRNPSYYMHKPLHSEESAVEVKADDQDVQNFLLEVIEGVLTDLEDSGCIQYDWKKDIIAPTNMGRIGSFYYLSHETMRMFAEQITEDLNLPQILQILCDAHEYAELPVRHNEDKLNEEMLHLMEWRLDPRRVDDPHIKTNILLQARFSRLPLPITDYYSDTKSVLDQAIRILHALIDTAADQGFLLPSLKTMNLMQMMVQGNWLTDSTLFNLPHFTPQVISRLWHQHNIQCLPELLYMLRKDEDKTSKTLQSSGLRNHQVTECIKILHTLPLVQIKVSKAPAKVDLGDDVNVEFSLERLNRTKTTTAYAPRWSKIFDEQWWIVIGFKSLNELYAVRKVRVPKHGVGKCTLNILPPETPGVHVFNVFLMSECYLGLDQEFELQLEVVETLQ
jgi:activating signal cointegrator complex subunit 3